MQLKCYTQYASKFEKLSSGHRTGKVQFSFQSQRRKECSSYRTTALISHASKVMLKILQVSLQQYVNRELPVVQATFRKGRRTRDQIANICWITEKARVSSRETPASASLTSFVVDHNPLQKTLQETGTPDHLTCFPRNVYAGQEATVRTGHGTTD